MKRDYIDFFYVEPHQIAMHDRLLNWARWVSVRCAARQHPMWLQGKSNTRQWHQPEARVEVDQLDGHALEKAVAQLPTAQREALRWHYVRQTPPGQARRKLGVTAEGLHRLVRDGRQMLMNRMEARTL